MQRFEPRRLVAIANALLLAVCTLLAVRIGVVVIDGIDIDYEPIPLATPVESSGSLPAGDWRLFGEPEQADYGLSRPLPATPLSLKLRGAVTGQRGYAIIVDGEGDEGVYRVGDEVPGGAEVLEIEPRRVVLERDGNREALELPGSEPGASAVVQGDGKPGREDEGGLASGIGIGSLGSMTSRLSLDPEALARRITILPVASGGFRVRAGRDAAVFRQLGFHTNDVVVAINGQPVDNREDVRAVFESFEPGESLAITVRRGERKLVLTPDLSQTGGANSR